MQSFDESYYQNNNQLEDRPALWFYARLVRRLLGPGPVLDFGCGTGFLLRRLQPHMQVSGLERSEFCRSNLKKSLPEIPAYEDIHLLPEKVFSGVVALHVFEHIPDVELVEVLEALRLSLKDEGRLLSVMPDAGGRGRQLKGDRWSGFQDPTHVNLKSAAEWEKFFEEQGFEVLHKGTDGLWDFPYRPQLPLLLNYLRYAWGTVLQFLAGRLILPAGTGESAVLLLQKSAGNGISR